MASKPFFIVSDIHLGAVPRSTEHAFRDFLACTRETAAGLLINGDLFDFWFEYRSVMLREHYRVLASLADLVERGIPVWFVGGNHDAWGGDFLTREVGIKILQGPLKIDLANRRTLVAHGDGVGGRDLGYRVMRRILRNRLTVGAFRLLHPDLGHGIARVVSTTERKAARVNGADVNRAAFLRRWASERLEEDLSLDLVVAGHVHLPTVQEILPGRFYANAGDWITNYTYLELPPGGGAPELRRWPAVRAGG